ncbi:uncharacterized protein LOC144862221 [Branchiostoma floridae x Branchiostoma japonicum]
MAQGYGAKGHDEPDLARDMARLSRAEARERENGHQENIPQSEIHLAVAINRMASFALLDNLLLSVNVRKLANAGLFYPGTGNKLMCFQCKGTIDIESWTDHNEPIGKHNRSYPQCSNSKALDVADGGSGHHVNGECKTQRPLASSKYETKIDSTDAGASNSKKTVVNDVRSCNSLCPKDLNTELHRLHTYYGYGWPMDTPVSPEQLAKLGFFYLGVRDKVECAFCGGVLHQWEQGDDPKVEHERHYSHCPYIRGYATANVPLESTKQPSTSHEDTNSTTKLSPFIRQSSLPQSATLSSQCQQQSRYSHETEKRPQTENKKGPKRPDLSSEELRVSTFLRWPLYSPIAPRKLAQAGFYYTHVDDQVRCFWCDGGLKDWQAGDDPWTEHARWYGEECDFVLRQKTLSFVQEVKRRHPVPGQVRHEEETFNQAFVSSGAVTIGSQQAGVQNPQTETPYHAMFQEAMDSRLIQSALEMGFERQQVENIVHKQLRRHGRPFAKMTDIVEALLAQGESQDSDEDEDKKNAGEAKTQPTQESPSMSGAQAPPDPSEAQLAAQGGEEDPAPSDVSSLQRQLQQLLEERTCKICMDESACMVLIPCGHMCCCENCVQMLRARGGRCPMCRARIQRVQKTFVASKQTKRKREKYSQSKANMAQGYGAKGHNEPIGKHNRSYPQCSNSPFIRQSSLPQSATLSSQCQQQSHYSHETEKRPQAENKKGPKRPDLSSEELRVSTFLRCIWPLYSPIAPRKLAQAGFYYTYVDNQVRCFWCDGGLKDWQAGDDPWTEHARWYGEECDFVLRQKTLSFIQEVKRRHPVLGQVRQEEETFNQTFVSSGAVASGSQQAGVQNPQTETPYHAMFQEAMDSRLIQSALEMGFEHQQVDNIVHKQLRRHGRPFTKLTDIVEALLAQGEGQNGAEDEDKKNAAEAQTQPTQESPPVSGAQAPPDPSEAQLAAQGGEEDPAPSDVSSLQRQLQQLLEERTCKICMDESACMVLIPCGHMCCCENCVQMLRARGGRCPMCRARIQRVQKTFVA